ncbi:alkaline phosphatase D family protein [Actinopolymorpha pittospori]
MGHGNTEKSAGLSRRGVLTWGAGVLAAGAAGKYIGSPSAYASPASVTSTPAGLQDPFGLGVASGDPLPDGVVLWTRVAPKPLDMFGGMPWQDVSVEWEVATDERFRRVVRRGRATARPEYTHSVHVDARGLQPGHEYFYRFRTGAEISPIGRTKTAPAPGQRVDRLNFAFASCQAWHSGFYTAYQHMADEDIDLVVFLGDYIYESGMNATGGARNVPVDERFIGQALTLDDYRNLYSIYKVDPNLQAAHARAPWIVTPDDHEVVNDYATLHEWSGMSELDFGVQRANAYRAYWEHMPLRQQPTGRDLQLYRKLSFGDLATFFVMDGRQYRSTHACNNHGTAVIGCEERLDPTRTMLGFEQEGWLLDGLGHSRTTWNVLANQVVMTRYKLNDEGTAYHHDLWDGYAPARDRLLQGIVERKVSNPVVITGDNHNNMAADVFLDGEDPTSPVVASEFLGTSIASGGDGADQSAAGENLLRLNPQMAFTNYQRGYVRCMLDRQTWRSDYRVVPYITRTGAPVSTRASFVVENGRRGLQTI